MRTARSPSSLASTLGCVALAGALAAQEPAKTPPPRTGAPAFPAAQQKGIDFLLAHQKDGVFSVKMGKREFPDPGFTALAVAALQSKPKDQRTAAEQAAITGGLAFVRKAQNENGSFGQNVPNYTTCAAVQALVRAADPADKEALAKAQAYVLGIQRTEKSGNSRSDVEYGGIGYGNKGERADLSNLQFALQALKDTNLPPDHEAFAKALVFLQRTQNLKASNDLGARKIQGEGGKEVPLVVGDDGGGVYYPGESPAGYVDLPDGRMPRSYGSMTYALLKTYTLCGLKGDDARVQAVVKWLGTHWTVAENPGGDPKLGEEIKYQGLYYYYLLLAQALTAAHIDRIDAVGKDGKAAPVDWRRDLRAQLESLQQKDGSWLNDKNGRFYENLDVLCTCYALLALEQCR